MPMRAADYEAYANAQQDLDPLVLFDADSARWGKPLPEALEKLSGARNPLSALRGRRVAGESRETRRGLRSFCVSTTFLSGSTRPWMSVLTTGVCRLCGCPLLKHVMDRIPSRKPQRTL